MVDKDEEIIGIAGDADQFKVSGFTLKKFYCTNCKKGIHSVPNKMRCKTTDCECECKTHYISRDGIHRIPYGVADPHQHPDMMSERKRDESDEFIDEINDNFRNRKK